MKPEAVVLAQLRSDLLNAMWLVYPQALSLDQLETAVRVAYLTRETAWLQSAIKAQLSMLNQSALIRPSTEGYLLTALGRRDRQQAARFLGSTNNQPTPPEAA
jgi:predicted transcriptional regulator